MTATVIPAHDKKAKSRSLSESEPETAAAVDDKEVVADPVKKSHEKPKLGLDNSGIEDDREKITRKLLHSIKQSFSIPFQEKMTRLFLFIINFDSHVISFNSHGNVLIRNRILHPESNILDLLRTSVSDISPKPVGLKDFQRALRQINVPKNLLLSKTKDQGDNSREL